MKLFSRSFECPCCGEKARFPWAWVLGVEVVFPCAGCGRRLRTGYKMGAALFGLALALALATANLGVWVFSAFSLPLFVVLAVPLWIFYGFLLRRAWLVAKYRRLIRKKGKEGGI